MLKTMWLRRCAQASRPSWIHNLTWKTWTFTRASAVRASCRPRLQVALFHRRGTNQRTLEQFDQARQKYHDDWLRVAAVKLYIDDVIEPHTAALVEPYADRPGTHGELDYPPEEFKQVVSRLDRMKFQIFIHSIGDRGIRTALDAIEYAEKQNGPRDRRDELIHMECLNQQDIPRFKQLGVIACMQPRHCAPDITGQWAKAVGPAGGSMPGRSAVCGIRGQRLLSVPIGTSRRWSL